MKSGFVALLGQPNAGKSTLVNQLIGEKVGIISKKPQTTRGRVVGVYNSKEAQICFVDSPGKINSEKGLNKFLAEEFRAIIKDSDVLFCILGMDARTMEELIEIVDVAAAAGKPYAVIITKRDLDPGLRAEKLSANLKEKYPDIKILIGSGLKPTDQFKKDIVQLATEMLPEGPALFDQDIYTTQNTKNLAAEVVREKCFEYLHQEVPYGLCVRTAKFDESSPQIYKLYVDIVIAKENHLPMVVGKSGMMIKRIGASSRIELEKILGKKVFLETKVKVKENWMENPRLMKELGYATAD